MIEAHTPLVYPAGEVDLTQQEHEDEPHRDDGDGGALRQQVREVPGGQEGRAEDGEDRTQHEQAKDDW